MNNIVPIISPNINSAQYGKNVDEVFENINKNFEILSNHDFIKGDKGDSMYIETIDLADNINILNQLKDAVSAQYNNTPKPINGVSVMDYFENPGNITLIYEVIGDTKEIISSLPYTFKDLRFQHLTNSLEFDNEVDYSCIITYDQGKFIANQIFPTIYFNESLGSFCWIINGIKTGLEAQGPRGAEGKAGIFKNVIVAKYDNNPDSDVYKISKILNEGEWKDVLTDKDDLDHVLRCAQYGVIENTPVMAMVETTGLGSENFVNAVYLSETYLDAAIAIDENQMLVVCSDVNKIFVVQPIPKSEIEKICNDIWGISER